MHAGRAFNATPKGAYPCPTIIAEKSTRARHSPYQTPIPRLDPRLGKRMSGSNLDVSTQPAKLRTESACNFKASIYNVAKRVQSVTKYSSGARIAAGARFHQVSALRHHTPLSLLSDVRTALRHAAFISVASANRSSGEGENAFSSHSQIAAGYGERSMRRVS